MDYKDMNAISIVRLMLTDGIITEEQAAKYFPELKESEDEKIREQVVYAINQLHVCECTKNKLLAWLKKQGEQKPTSKVEPKFEISDLITNGILVGEIDDIHEVGYHAYFGDHYADVPDPENWHKWSIQDAKEGDVLAFDDENIVMFKDLCNKTTFHSYCHIEEGAFSVSQDDMPDWWEGKGFHPATKEQRNTLMKAMADAGYTFDFEKKEIEQKPTNNQFTPEQADVLDKHIDKFLEQKQDVSIQIDPSEYINDMGGNGCYLKNTTRASTWSKADEHGFENCLYAIRETFKGVDNPHRVKTINWLKSIKERVQLKQEWGEEDEEIWLDSIIYLELFDAQGIHGNIAVPCINWLKSLKDRVQLQPEQEWSESDKDRIEELVVLIRHSNYTDGVKRKIISWLDSLKERVGCEVNCTTTKEWSEDDERMLNSFLHKLEVCDLLSNKEIIWIKNKIKSLKERYTWKPSDEQIKALSAINVTGAISYAGQGQELIDLYNDLKNLREE